MTKTRKLSRELLGLIALSAAVSLILFLLLSHVATAVAESYCFSNDIPMTEFDWIETDRWISAVSGILSCCSFTVLFLCLLDDRIAYIRKITKGIDSLRDPDHAVCISLEGNNELTQLAKAVNELSEARQQLRSKEQTLAREKEQLIRTLAHDIRTPLTSILAYSDLILQQPVAAEEQKNHLRLIRSKAEQIRDLTAILLDGTHRNLEQFEDGRLLLEQIVAEFEEMLEDQFTVAVNFSECPCFTARADVQELRRVFDNLASNVCKYADPQRPVNLSVRVQEGALLICQSNSVLPQKPRSEGYGLGLDSIRRIARLYGGSMSAEETDGQFCVSVIFRNL